MNFVLHHHLARLDLGSEIAALGAMLPDLWRMADRRLRAKPRIHIGEDDEPAVRELLRGIDHHLDVDHDFHRAPLFVEGERRAVELFEEAELRGGKMRLFAHIAWELALDGALLRSEGTENVLEAVQQSIRKTPTEALEKAADRHAPAKVDLAPFHQRLNELLLEVGAGPWIAGYAHGLGLARRLNGVRRRVHLAPLEDTELERMAEAGEALLEIAVDRLDRALKSGWKAQV